MRPAAAWLAGAGAWVVTLGGGAVAQQAAEPAAPTRPEAAAQAAVLARVPAPTLADASASAAWPAVTQTARPWIRWWWPGDAVEAQEITRHLEAFAQAGIGGVEITPIYGARGADARYIEYLSPRWVAMLEHTTREARRLGMGVDMATGTGWPFGGPGVSITDSSSSLALVDGRLSGKPTEMKVKRAAPGGEGLVLDPYSTAALDRYLQSFTRALAALPRGALRSQFHDSFEYYGASWSPGLAAKFREMHGYDIQQYAAEIAGAKPLDADTLGRIKGDYRRTLAAMHLEYVRRWVAWSHARGFIARNQAHGSPGRLLDLYGASDVPETESFGATPLPIPGLRQAPDDIRVDPDPPINLIGRFASSAAHVNGRALASSETLTWLRENFREAPSQAKPQLDRLFIAGINHIFYHGTTYSPADATWPGWFFYAATQLNPTNPLWRDLSAMHEYVARVQSVLQQGRPDNDVLFYWPEADEQDDAEGLMRQHGMHENQWLVDSPAGREALDALHLGRALDFISDAQVQALTVDRDGNLRAPGGRYRVLVVPPTRRMPVATLAAIVQLRKGGAMVRLYALPGDVPGLGRLAERRAEFQQLLASEELRRKPAASDEIPGFAKTRPEPAVQRGLSFTRRARADGVDYFFVNLGALPFDGWLELATDGRRADLLDPLTGEAGAAAVRMEDGRPAVYLQLDPGSSMIVRSYRATTRRGLAPWKYWREGPPAIELAGDWSLEFLSGGPELPAAVKTGPGSWTALADPRAARFSGTARYRIEFPAPAAAADDWQLDLGDVRETARVTVNGRFLGTVWSLPARIRVGAALRPGSNLLEIEVTNLPANRVRDLDLRKVDWKIMKDINLASLRYESLDAAGWAPEPSGLLGPVRLVPLRALSPGAPH